MAPYYPVFLDLKGRLCVVIGGGEVAQRKLEALLESAAQVTVISPEVTPDIRHKADLGQVTWRARGYSSGDLKGAFLAIAATDDSGINRAVSDEATRQRVLLNVVDVPSLCVFIAPAIVRRGDVTIALSTNGTSPALARKLRESLEQSESLEYAHLSGILSEARKELKQRGITVDPDIWQGSITPDLVDLVKSGRSEEAFDQLIAKLAKGTPKKAATAPSRRTA